METIPQQLNAAAQHIADLAATLERRAAQEGSLEPHPDTVALLQRRGVDRRQIHPNVPAALDLARRAEAYGRDRGLNLGDAYATALDTFLRASGYPPSLPAAQ
ncbi:hypothetical protein [Streptomyces sp. NPDC088739]|uniref:hypothetical protein n=1 Tax=Streptomyces sp. NPDC088739 TaxID=3365882 RepID=UPI00382081D0